MSNKLEILWTNLKGKNPEMPDYKTFAADMADGNKLHALWEGLSKRNEGMPDYQTFAADMGFEAGAQPQPSALPTLQELIQQKDQLLTQRKQLTRHTTQNDYVWDAQAGKMVLHPSAPSYNGIDFSEDRDSKIQKIDDQLKSLQAPIQSGLEQEVAGLEPLVTNARVRHNIEGEKYNNYQSKTDVARMRLMGQTIPPEVKDWQQRGRAIDIAEDYLNTAKNIVALPQKDQQNAISHWLDGVSDADWSILAFTGIKNLRDSKYMADILARKSKNQPLSAEEELALYISANSDQIVGSKDVHWAYNIGLSSPDVLSFMASMALGGGIGGIAGKLLPAGAKVAQKVVPKVVQTAVVTNTPSTHAAAYQRDIGNYEVSITPNEPDKTAVMELEGARSHGENLVLSMGEAAIEMLSEMAGVPISKGRKAALGAIARKFPNAKLVQGTQKLAQKLDDFFDPAKATNMFSKLLTKGKRAASINDFVSEVAEEYLSGIGNLPIPKSVLEEKVRENINQQREANGLPPLSDWDELWSLEQFKQTLFAVAPM